MFLFFFRDCKAILIYVILCISLEPKFSHFFIISNTAFADHEIVCSITNTFVISFIHLHNMRRLTLFRTQTVEVIFKIDNIIVFSVHGTVQHSEKRVVRIVMAKEPLSEVQQLLAREEMRSKKKWFCQA